MDTIDQIEELLLGHGKARAARGPDAPVSLLSHALQCAQLAEWAAAPDALVAAALLHDVGHLIEPLPGSDRIDDVHELRALGLLQRSFDADVVEPVRLHVQAKRYLVAVDGGYAGTLSAASRHTLALQGGAMSADEVCWFEALPHAVQAVTLRRWDDAAHQPGQRTPPLEYYLDLLRAVRRRPEPAARTRIGAADVA